MPELMSIITVDVSCKDTSFTAAVRNYRCQCQYYSVDARYSIQTLQLVSSVIDAQLLSGLKTAIFFLLISDVTFHYYSQYDRYKGITVKNYRQQYWYHFFKVRCSIPVS